MDRVVVLLLRLKLLRLPQLIRALQELRGRLQSWHCPHLPTSASSVVVVATAWDVFQRQFAMEALAHRGHDHVLAARAQGFQIAGDGPLQIADPDPGQARVELHDLALLVREPLGLMVVVEPLRPAPRLAVNGAAAALLGLVLFWFVGLSHHLRAEVLERFA